MQRTLRKDLKVECGLQLPHCSHVLKMTIDLLLAQSSTKWGSLVIPVTLHLTFKVRQEPLLGAVGATLSRVGKNCMVL